MLHRKKNFYFEKKLVHNSKNPKVLGKSLGLNVNGGNNLAGIYLLKVSNRSTRTRCEICSKLTIKTSERRQWRLVCSSFSVANFEHVIARWEGKSLSE